MPNVACKDCKFWKSVDKKEPKKRCTKAAPFEGRDDKRKLAMTSPVDGCLEGEKA